jgi:hypothetical protein
MSTRPNANHGFAFTTQGTLTRPADTTAYASGDLVANSTTAGSVVPVSLLNVVLTNGNEGAVSGAVRLEACRIRKTGTGTTSASFRVHLFQTSPTSAAGDNAAFSSNNAANYLGAFDVAVDRAFTDGAAGRGLSVTGTPMTVTLASGTTVFALVEARGAYTPATSEVFTIVLEGYRFPAT